MKSFERVIQEGEDKRRKAAESDACYAQRIQRKNRLLGFAGFTVGFMTNFLIGSTHGVGVFYYIAPLVMSLLGGYLIGRLSAGILAGILIYGLALFIALALNFMASSIQLIPSFGHLMILIFFAASWPLLGALLAFLNAQYDPDGSPI